MQLPGMNQNVTSTPGTLNSTSSEHSSASASQTSPSYDTEEETTTSDDESIISITSNRQLRPHAPIIYNEAVLEHLHGQPQVRTLNNVSIPLLIDSSEEDTEMDTSETDEKNEQFI